MAFKAEDKISEIFQDLDLRAPQRSLPQQPSDGGGGNTNYNIGPINIYAPGGPGGTGGGGGGGGLHVGGDKAVVSSKMSEFKAVFRNVKMPYEMQHYAVDCATLGFIKNFSYVDIAGYIRKEFDKKYNGRWHCIVGPPNFGCSVQHESNCYINFEMGENRILLFKSG